MANHFNICFLTQFYDRWKDDPNNDISQFSAVMDQIEDEAN